MSAKFLTKEQIEKVKFFQKNEITEYHIYKRLAKRVNNDNSQILDEIAEDELSHYNFWMKYSGEDVKPSKWKSFQVLLDYPLVWSYFWH